MPSLSQYIHLGLDVAKDSISVGILQPDDDVPDVERIFHDEPSVRRLIGRFEERSRLWACYEAGPNGYELHRLLTSLGLRCDVVAPSLIPRSPGDRVKTDRRDCRRLARLHRAGELVAIRVPSAPEEGVRDLCRARSVAVEDRRRARQRLGSFLLRHGVVWRGGANWTMKHHEWLARQRFTEASVASAYAFYRADVANREATVDAIEAELALWFSRPPFTDAVRRLSAYRGIAQVGALGLAAEVCDWRASPARPRSWASPGWFPPSTPPAIGPVAGGSHVPATCTCARSWWRAPGPTSTGPSSVPSCGAATRGSTPTSSPGRGARSCACAPGGVAWPPARTPATP